MDAIGKALYEIDQAAAEMRTTRTRYEADREMRDLDDVARDVVATARRWNRKDPARAAALILESVFDETLDAPSWCFLKALVDREFLPPVEVVSAMLKASV